MVLSVLLECIWMSEMWAGKWSVKFGGLDCLRTHACDLITATKLKLREEKLYERKIKKIEQRQRLCIGTYRTTYYSKDYHVLPLLKKSQIYPTASVWIVRRNWVSARNLCKQGQNVQKEHRKKPYWIKSLMVPFLVNMIFYTALTVIRTFWAYVSDQKKKKLLSVKNKYLR